MSRTHGTQGVLEPLPVHLAPSGEERRAEYEAYCRRESLALLSLVPRDELRAFYRRAREWATREGCLNEKDPLATAAAYGRHLLPLPPFAVWRRDLEHHQAEHLDALERVAGGLSRDQPRVLGRRRFESSEGATWSAALHVFPSAGRWRGFVRFEGPGGSSVRTAEVFSEESSVDIRDRFLSFQDATLVAFLRSAMP